MTIQAMETEKFRRLSKSRQLDIRVTTSKEWGYFIGIVLGDGCVSRYKSNFKIIVGSTRPEIVDKFYECVNNLGLHCGYEIANKNPKHTTHLVVVKEGTLAYTATLLSRQVFIWMRPYKNEDSHFTVPEIVYRHRSMLRGFLQGFYDAEGGVYKKSRNSSSISCFSKHGENLEQIQRGLDILGIYSYMFSVPTESVLTIGRQEDRILFKKLIGFRIKRKMDRLL